MCPRSLYQQCVSSADCDDDDFSSSYVLDFFTIHALLIRRHPIVVAMETVSMHSF